MYLCAYHKLSLFYLALFEGSVAAYFLSLHFRKLIHNFYLGYLITF